MYVRAVCVHGVNVNGKIGILRRGISRKSRGAVNAIYSRLAYSSLEKYLKRVSPLVILARRNGNPLEGVFFFFFWWSCVAPKESWFFWRRRRGKRGLLLFAIQSFWRDYRSSKNIIPFYSLWKCFVMEIFLLVGEILLFSCIMEIILMKIKIK